MNINLAPIAAVLCFIFYSVIATSTGGTVTAAASPLLIVGIALFIWHDKHDSGTEVAG